MVDLSKIEEIYHAALALPEAERAAFIESTCNGDEHLLREVTSLIELDSEADSFIESPPDDVAADVIADRGPRQDLIGRALGKYRVLSRIGAGGMGEVFLGEDTKLDRKVALKILPSQFAADRERELRFEQEAKAISALNHRNIITIFDIEKVNDISFMATEYVDGVTLRQKIASGPVFWRDAVEISLQTASALDAAHSLGIIHRDIKPANVMVRGDGEVKVLDFGLAKLMMPAGASGSFDTRDHTQQDRVMGTINYMSPEQALGEKLDGRTDIFSLGVVMHEMISGSQLFTGTSDAAIYNATFTKVAPPLHASNPEVPPELDLIISRALAKKADERYQTAGELRRELRQLTETSGEMILSGSGSHDSRKAARSWAGILVPVAALLLLSLVVLGLYAWNAGSASPERAKNFRFTQLTSDSEALMPSLSPDGKTVIYSSRRSGNWDIYTQRVGGSNAVNLTQASQSDDREAVFSPNGEQIAFHSNRVGASGIFVMGATGENVRQISDFGYSPAWSPDGSEIVFSTSATDDPTSRVSYPASLWIVDVTSGNRRELTKGDAVQPQWSPNGDRIAFWSADSGSTRDIKTVARAGGEAVPVTNDPELDWNPVWSRDGKYIYFSSYRGGSMNFWRVAVDERSGKPLGALEPFTTPSTYSQNLAFSADERAFVFAQQSNISSITHAEFEPQSEILHPKITVIGKSSRYDRNPSVSPDGEWLAFDAIKDGQPDLFIMRRDGRDLLQLTNDIDKDRAPRWSPDGKQILFYSNRSGKNESWVVNANASGLRQMTFDTEPDGLIAFWSPDGTKIVQAVTQNYPRIFDAAYPLVGQTPFQIPGENDPSIWEMPYSWSPDGSKIAQIRLASDADLTGIVVYNLLTNKHEVVSETGDVPIWLADSRRLLFSEGNKIFLLDTFSKRKKELLTLGPTDIVSGITLSPDNRSAYFSLGKRESNIWLGTLDE